MDSSTFSSLFSHGPMDFSKMSRGSTGSGSRSTSAGSSLKDSEKPASPVYPSAVLGLPEYEYPAAAPWSNSATQKLPEFDYPAALTVKNTFIGTQPSRPRSLDGFYEERHTKSCPVSGISAPPGLEDLVDPEEAVARLFALEAAHQREAEIHNLSESTLGLTSTRFFDSQCSFEAPQRQPQRGFDCFHNHAQPASLTASPMQAPPLPILLDSLLGSQSPQHKPAPEQWLAAACPPPVPAMMPEAWAIQQAPPLPELVIGSSDCPTVGSQGHFFGACKPCAFLYTKGCANGVSCEFCHLCDAGEKKRRSKDKRAFKQMAKRDGTSTIMHL